MLERQVASEGPGLVPNWDGSLLDLPGGERVFVAATPAASGRQPVLCVHGMAGSASNWTDLMAELASDFACYAVDMPGSGWSPPPATPAGYSVKAQVETVIKVIEAVGGPVHLIGHSMGGLVSVRVAATRPDLVRTLTLISPALPDPLIHPSLIGFPLLALPKVGGWLLGRVDAMPAEARIRSVMGTIFYDPDAISRQRVREAIEEMRRREALGYVNEALVGAARALTVEYIRPSFAAANAWRLAHQVRCPVLALYGSHDQLVDPRKAARAAREFADCRVMVLPCTGHVAMVEHTARVAAEFRGMTAAAAGFDPITETLT
jgi:pimeloyl-ACP methyl ester carboxylesterase